MYTRSPQILVNFFLENGGPVTTAVLGANPLSPNLSEMAWNFLTPFYWIDVYSFRMVYVNFHNPICPRDFSGKGEGEGVGMSSKISFAAKLLLTHLEFSNAITLDGSR